MDTKWKDVGKDIQCKVVEKDIECTYSFPKERTYSVHVARKTQSEVSVPKPFFVKVSAAPLDHSKCKVRAETPLFARRPTKVILKLELFDCILMPYEYSKLDKNALKMKINGNLCSIVESHHFIINKPNETSLEVSVIEEGSVVCSLEYEGQTLGEPFQIDLIQVVPYRENDYMSDVNDHNSKLLIYKIFDRKPSNINMKNINRILQKDHKRGILPHDIAPMDDHQTVSVDLATFKESTQRCSVREVFSTLIEGLHYRDQASKFNEKREEWKLKSETEYQSRRYEYANEYSEIKERFGELMNSSNRSASDAIFGFFNRGLSVNEIDLHGQLVADEAKLNAHKRQLLEKMNKDDATRRIGIEREEMDEAIRHLRLRMDKVVEETSSEWLEIIVGAGHHSLGQRQKIRPKVETFLKEQGQVYRECNKGSLLITFREYNGKQPCHATFYCSKCDKTWESNSSWRGKWQKCFKCDKKGKDSKCTPMKLRNRETPQSRGSTNTGTSFTREDHKKLCQMCIEKGQDCSTP